MVPSALVLAGAELVNLSKKKEHAITIVVALTKAPPLILPSQLLSLLGHIARVSGVSGVELNSELGCSLPVSHALWSFMGP